MCAFCGGVCGNGEAARVAAACLVGRTTCRARSCSVLRPSWGCHSTSAPPPPRPPSASDRLLPAASWAAARRQTEALRSSPPATTQPCSPALEERSLEVEGRPRALCLLHTPRRCRHRTRRTPLLVPCPGPPVRRLVSGAKGGTWTELHRTSPPSQMRAPPTHASPRHTSNHASYLRRRRRTLALSSATPCAKLQASP